MNQITDSGAAHNTGSESVKNYERETEQRFIRDLITEERQKREHQFDEQYKLYSNMQHIVHNLEQELMSKMKDHRG